ncbi:peroxisome assembly protein (Peroxin-2) [Rhodosporidiobolus nylandii]
MASTSTSAGPSSGSPVELERFWHPPPPSLSSLPAIRASLAALTPPALRISRVAQLDAELLDNELESILHAPVKTALEGVRPGNRSWEPELLALLRVAVMRLSLWESGASYGSGLQNLRYRDEAAHEAGRGGTDAPLTRVQKLAYTALVVLPPYLHARLQDRMLSSSWADEPLPRSWLSLFDLRRLILTRGRRREEEAIQMKREWKRTAWELLGVGEKLAALAGLLNFLVFLHNGRYRSLVDRILKMRLVYAQRSFVPNVSFEYLNRQLVWEAFTEFLLFILPLINLHRFRLRLSKAITSRAAKSGILRTLASALPTPVASTLGLSSLSSLSSSTTPSSSEKSTGPLAHLPSHTCPICYSLSTAAHAANLPAASYADPTLPSASLMAPSGPSGPTDTTLKIPYVADCRGGCRFCYYCIVGALARADEEAEEGWECLRCGGMITSVRREMADEGVVLEEDEGGEESEAEDKEDEKRSETDGYEVIEKQ